MPPLPEPVAYVQVDQNIDGGVFISRAQLDVRRTVWVRARDTQYAIRTFDRSRRRVHPADLADPTDPLDGHTVNLFSGGVSGGLQLEPDEPVQRGRTYFVLSRASARRPAPPEFSRGAGGLPACDPRAEWTGQLLYVPVRRESSLDRWINEACGRDVVDARPRLELVSPPLTRLEPDGTHVVSSGADVLFAVRGGEWVRPHVEVVDELTGRSEAWTTDVAAGGCFRLPQPPAGEFTVHVHEWDWVSLRLRVASGPAPIPPDIRLITRAADGGPEIGAPLHGFDADARWASLLSGTETWGRVEMAVAYPTALSWRAADGVDHEASGLSSPDRFVAALSDCLRGRPQAARLDAGSFGRVEWTRPAPSPVAAAPPVTLRRSLEQRLNWLLLSRPRADIRPGIPVGIRIAPDCERRVASGQRDLVRAFLARPGWPGDLIAHARSAARELASTCGGGWVLPVIPVFWASIQTSWRSARNPSLALA